MMDIINPKQVVLFPELMVDMDLPSITTLPEYDRALQNFIKMSDFGAFIELNVAGMEKSFSFSLNELQVPRRYRQSRQDSNSPVYHLFPATIRNHLNRLKYDARSFFNRTNSVKTSYGYFLLRQYFYLWDLHRKNFKSNVIEYLQQEIGELRYQKYFTSSWNEAVDWLRTGIKRKYHHLLPAADIAQIRKDRERLNAVNMTISHLDREEPDYFYNCFVLKTAHIPTDLEDYINGISIFSTFKTIHLEQLKKTEINSLEDLLEFFSTLPQQS
ncbi:MAG: hypothetical protein JXR87_00210 [Candidatus Marinimicrobia bacterium]|nr:hypothetical protein [Candidatus Neomarinimicrobiota bacterium]